MMIPLGLMIEADAWKLLIDVRNPEWLDNDNENDNDDFGTRLHRYVKMCSMSYGFTYDIELVYVTVKHPWS